MKPMALIAWLVLLLPACSDACVKWRLSSASLRLGSCEFPEDEFRFDVIRRRAVQLLSDTKENVLTIVSFYVRGIDDPLDQVFPSEMTFDGWRAWYDRTLNEPHPVARLLAVHESAIIEFRDLQGHVQREVLSGSDPTVVEIGQRSFHLLHISVGRPVDPSNLRMRLYLQTSEGLVLDEMERLRSLILAVYPPGRYTINVRQDYWFATDPVFPGRYLFVDTLSNPPSEREYRSRPWGLCTYPLGSCLISKAQN